MRVHVGLPVENGTPDQDKAFAVTNLQFVTRACAAVGAPRKISIRPRKVKVRLSFSRDSDTTVKPFRLRRPNAKMRFVFADNLRSYRITPLHSGVFSSGHRAMVVFDLASPVKLVRPK